MRRLLDILGKSSRQGILRSSDRVTLRAGMDGESYESELYHGLEWLLKGICKKSQIEKQVARLHFDNLSHRK